MNEIITESKMSRRRFFKRKAREVLYSGWVVLILAFLITACFNVGIRQLGASFQSLFFALGAPMNVVLFFDTVYLLLSVVVTVPIVYGLFRFGNNICDGKGNLTDLFSVFRSAAELNRVFTLFFVLVFKSILNFVPFIASCVFLKFYYFDGIFGVSVALYGVDLIKLGITLVMLMLFYLGLSLSAKYIVAVYVSIVRDNIPVRDCFMIASNCNHVRSNEFAILALSFLPLFAASLFTAGLLFILFTLPYMLLCFVIMSRFTYEAEMENKDAEKIMYTPENIQTNEYED